MSFFNLALQNENLLQNLYITSDELQHYKSMLPKMLSLSLNNRQLYDLELLLNGGFSPLTGFMTRNNYESVLTNMRLLDQTLWPMPIVLDVTTAFAKSLSLYNYIALQNMEGTPIAILMVEDIWQPNKTEEAIKVFGTDDIEHPAVNYLINNTQELYIGGKLLGLTQPSHYDFTHLRHTPQQLRKKFAEIGWSKVVAFQTRNPMHRAHYELTLRAAQECNANLLIHPVVGMTKPGDIDHYTRVRCYEKLLLRYPSKTLLSLLPLAMRMAGPREALWHAIIRKNYGCSHFIIGRDHAGPGKNSKGKDFYQPYEAQDLVAKHQSEIGITMVPFQEMVYVKSENKYFPIDQVVNNPQDDILNISGTELRRKLQTGEEIPEWFSFPEIITELHSTYPSKTQQGFTIFFTGLSGAGKSTIANALLSKLMEIGGRSVTLLDGDLVRQNLSSELGFSKEHRDLNILRIGYVACEITKHRGVAICAPIAPYFSTRKKVRDMISTVGGFIEVYVDTPVNICEQRDPKGLYAKARLGIIKEFTGVSDPYEAPINAELTVSTEQTDVMSNVDCILQYLKTEGFIPNY